MMIALVFICVGSNSSVDRFPELLERRAPSEVVTRFIVLESLKNGVSGIDLIAVRNASLQRSRLKTMSQHFSLFPAVHAPKNSNEGKSWHAAVSYRDPDGRFWVLACSGNPPKFLKRSVVDRELISVRYSPNGSGLALLSRLGDSEFLEIYSLDGLLRLSQKVLGQEVFGGWWSDSDVVFLNTKLNRLSLLNVTRRRVTATIDLPSSFSLLNQVPLASADRVLAIGVRTGNRPFFGLLTRSGRLQLSKLQHRLSETFWAKHERFFVAHAYAYLASPDAPFEAAPPTGHWIGLYDGKTLSLTKTLAKAEVSLGDTAPFEIVGLEPDGSAAYIWQRDWDGRKAGVWRLDLSSGKWSLTFPTGPETRAVRFVG
jgi:hypothetical protein